LTSAFTRVDDDLFFAGTQGGWRACRPTYLCSHWTDQGIKNNKISPSRAAEVTKQVESSGGRVRELLWTVGEYDLVAVMEFPDDETATAVFLQVGSVGNVRSNTMRAFNADEMTAIIGKTG
jgi:uncharacterized protein with GYD domain